MFIKATSQAIWDAITTPEWTQRYGYSLRDMYELRPGGAYRGRANAGMLAMVMPDIVADGEVIESDPPHKLVVSWRMAMDPRPAAEGFTHLTYEIAEGRDGVTRLSVIHDLTGTPGHAAMGRGRPAGTWSRRRLDMASATSSRCWRAAHRCRRARAGRL